ncbi:MAG: tRNA threonylcarbamoyladenosine dehydratase [Zoogloeaceae bacterium]|jgi:tRNA A37 threonylcarbamoyladenosine dehydratase|nr:tRNA threonylcarbamoyladenosine dehydratase [Zoogloeaceae bacterium]
MTQADVAPDLERRFGGVRRLYGATAFARFTTAHVTLAGVGGVGSWTAEALARSGIGRLTLIDLDMVAESNTNRQIHALDDVYGRAKVEVMAERIRAIHPGCVLIPIEEFITPENVAARIPRDCAVVVDATDNAHAKAALIAHCRRHDIAVISCGAAGGKRDPSRLARADLAHVADDPLLARVRSLLRREYGFPKGNDRGKRGNEARSFGVAALFSSERIRMPETCAAPQGLSCAGYGSSVCVTAAMGFLAAASTLEMLAAPTFSTSPS